MEFKDFHNFRYSHMKFQDFHDLQKFLCGIIGLHYFIDALFESENFIDFRHSHLEFKIF